MSDLKETIKELFREGGVLTLGAYDTATEQQVNDFLTLLNAWRLGGGACDVYPCMRWVLLTPENVPEHAVLAGCFDPTKSQYKQKIVGRITYYPGKNKDCFRAYNGQKLMVCTHFIDLSLFDL